MPVAMIGVFKKSLGRASLCLASVLTLLSLHIAGGDIAARAKEEGRGKRSPEVRKCIAKCGEEFTKCRREQIVWKDGPANKCVRMGAKCAKKC